MHANNYVSLFLRHLQSYLILLHFTLLHSTGVNIFTLKARPSTSKNIITPFIVLLTLLWWSGTELTVSRSKFCVWQISKCNFSKFYTRRTRGKETIMPTVMQKPNSWQVLGFGEAEKRQQRVGKGFIPQVYFQGQWIKTQEEHPHPLGQSPQLNSMQNIGGLQPAGYIRRGIQVVWAGKGTNQWPCKQVWEPGNYSLSPVPTLLYGSPRAWKLLSWPFPYTYYSDW